MSFHYPYVLLALVVPAALLLWVWRRESGRLVLPFDHGKPGSGRRWRFAVGMAESLAPLLLAVAIILLAGPQRTGEPQTKRALTNIEMCVDVSGSMTAPFAEGTRYDGAMKAVEEFCTYRKGDAFGLTFFGNNVLHWCPLTADISAVRCSPPFMRPENLPAGFGGTEIGKALIACKQVLIQRQEGDRAIILITDGMSADLHSGNADTIAKELRDANISVFAVIIGDDRIQDEVVTITGVTGGDVFVAGDPDALKIVFKRIDIMKQARLEKSFAETLDNFMPYCIAGMALVGLATVSLYGLRYTPW